jgi:hypothetical protein
VLVQLFVGHYTSKQVQLVSPDRFGGRYGPATPSLGRHSGPSGGAVGVPKRPPAAAKAVRTCYVNAQGSRAKWRAGPGEARLCPARFVTTYVDLFGRLPFPPSVWSTLSLAVTSSFRMKSMYTSSPPFWRQPHRGIQCGVRRSLVCGAGGTNLGLKLELRKVPTEIIVIGSAVKPSGN